MNFISVSQYLNKLQILFFVLLMAPLLVFITLYFFFPDNPVEPRKEYLIIIPFAAIDFILGMIIFNKKIKSVRNAQGLGAKLDKYFEITIVRYGFLASAGLLLALGFYLTKSDVFSALYALSLLLSAMYWPTAARVCHELMLKGDEREMVFYKKDRF